MAIPADQLGLPCRTKRLLRNALTDLLPPMVVDRQVKTSLVPLFEKGLLQEERQKVQMILNEPQIVEREFVRADWIESELTADHDWIRDGYLLWISISLELWLRQWFGS
jgi:hypothetical protein